MLAPSELKEIHHLGKSPVISIETSRMTTPLVLAESGLIVEYLIQHFGPHLAPRKWQEGKEGEVGGESEEWMRYRYFMHYPEGSLMTYMIVALLVRSELVSPLVEGLADSVTRHKIVICTVFHSANHEEHCQENRVQLLGSKFQNTL